MQWLADKLQSARLYGILDAGYCQASDWLEMARKLHRGKVDIFQIRAKKLSEAEIFEYGKPVAEFCLEQEIPLVINDYPKLVKKIGATGCHVGQDDMTVQEARELVGDDSLIVGKSTHSYDQAVNALSEKPDYIGFGPLYSTPTKPDYGQIGLQDIRRVHDEVDIPIFCIGGIKKENLPEVIDAGAKRAVIVSGLLCAEDLCQYASFCKSQLNS